MTALAPLERRRWFQRTGIQEYWIVDPDARIIELVVRA